MGTEHHWTRRYWWILIFSTDIGDIFFLFDKIPLKEVFFFDKSPFSVGSDSIGVKLPGNKVDSFRYGAKWNKYLLRWLGRPTF